MELIKIEKSGNNLVTTSRNLAEVLGKRHDHVLRDLEVILENPNVGNLIIESEYKAEGQTRKYKQYLLTKDGLILYLFNIQGYNNEVSGLKGKKLKEAKELKEG